MDSCHKTVICVNLAADEASFPLAGGVRRRQC